MKSPDKTNPEHEDLCCLAAARHDRGDLPGAERAYARILEENPCHRDAMAGLISVLRAALRFDEAITLCRQVEILWPGQTGFIPALAGLLRMAGMPDEAEGEAMRACRVAECNPDGWIELGLAQENRGAFSLAHTAYERAVAVDPGYLRAHWHLAGAAARLGLIDAAILHYQACVAIEPEDTFGARLKLAEFGVVPIPEKAPAAFVRALFDDYAPQFDAALLGDLSYKGPQVLMEAIARGTGPESHWPPPARSLDILDAGCGTGLASAVLSPLARCLTGVDLSPAMLTKAAERRVYDHLEEADVVDAMRVRPDCHDLIFAADVLVYVGDLRPVLAAAHSSLRRGGMFAFTVERQDGRCAKGWRLDAATRRYRHSPDWVLRAASDLGFAVLTAEDTFTRRNAGIDVPGLAVVLQRP